MNSHNINTPFDLVFTPLVYPPFVKRVQDAIIAPSGNALITTESNLKLTTENGQFLITED